MSQVIQKVCCICGQDVSGKKRTKDAEGNYYCQQCYVAYAANTPPPADADVYACSVCRGTFPSAQVCDADGVVVCHECWQTRQSQQQHLGARTAIKVDAERKPKRGKGETLFLRACSVFVAVVVLVGMIALFMDSGDAVKQPGAQTETTTRRQYGLPRVVVKNADGGAEPSVKFSEWHKKGVDWALYGTMVWDGDLAVDEIRYEVKQDGVRIKSGRVYVEGGYIRAKEATQVSVSLGREPKGDMSILIEVRH